MHREIDNKSQSEKVVLQIRKVEQIYIGIVI